MMRVKSGAETRVREEDKAPNHLCPTPTRKVCVRIPIHLVLLLVVYGDASHNLSDVVFSVDRQTLKTMEFKDTAGATVGLLLWTHLPDTDCDTIALWSGFSLTYDSHSRKATLHFNPGDSNANSMSPEKCVERIQSLLKAGAPRAQEQHELLVNVQSICEGARPNFDDHPFLGAKGPDRLTTIYPFAITADDIPPLEMELHHGQGEMSPCQWTEISCRHFVCSVMLGSSD
jgi:hypothetical protein